MTRHGRTAVSPPWKTTQEADGQVDRLGDILFVTTTAALDARCYAREGFGSDIVNTIKTKAKGN